MCLAWRLELILIVKRSGIQYRVVACMQRLLVALLLDLVLALKLVRGQEQIALVMVLRAASF